MGTRLYPLQLRYSDVFFSSALIAVLLRVHVLVQCDMLVMVITDHRIIKISPCILGLIAVAAILLLVIPTVFVTHRIRTPVDFTNNPEPFCLLLAVELRSTCLVDCLRCISIVTCNSHFCYSSVHTSSDWLCLRY